MRNIAKQYMQPLVVISIFWNIFVARADAFMLRIYGAEPQAHSLSTIAVISKTAPFVAILFAIGAFAFHLHFENAQKSTLLNEADFLASFVRRDIVMLYLSLLLPFIKLIYYYDYILKSALQF